MATTRFNGTVRKPLTIQYEGITVTGDAYKGTPALPILTLGSGLGADGGIGPVDEVSREIQFLANQTTPVRDVRDGRLNLSVNGTINSVTILPKFRVLSPWGVVPPVQLPFEIYCSMQAQLYVQLSPPFGPVTLNSTQQAPGPIVSMDVTADVSQVQYLLPYRQQYLTEDITFQFGFTILAIDYTAGGSAMVSMAAAKTAKKSAKKK